MNKSNLKSYAFQARPAKVSVQRDHLIGRIQ